ncbi:hypothetical protein PL318_28745 [Burkholderia pseudomallei]|nr:hypothetical protein [Burkholderia pseudomallei]WCE22232.1 hypothetical protein PL318_28745 [Burkholderia pseudomallei]WCK58809.1 hypothetical protein AQ936_009280 [Burkholderia pseudomallei]
MAVDDGLEKQGERTGMAADDACGRAVTISEMRTLRERGRRMSRRRAFEARAEIHVRPGPSVLKQALPRGDVRDPGVVEHESARRYRGRSPASAPRIAPRATSGPRCLPTTSSAARRRERARCRSRAGQPARAAHDTGIVSLRTRMRTRGSDPPIATGRLPAAHSSPMTARVSTRMSAARSGASRERTAATRAP